MSEEPETIDPEVLTPAGQRAVSYVFRRMLKVYLISMLTIALAFGVYTHTVEQAGRCAAKQYSWDGFHRQNQPLPTTGFTGELLVARTQANESRASNLKSLGSRPKC